MSTKVAQQNFEAVKIVKSASKLSRKRDNLLCIQLTNQILANL